MEVLYQLSYVGALAAILPPSSALNERAAYRKLAGARASCSP
jgi:hypothetical protein